MTMEAQHRMQLRASYALIYLFGGACTLFAVFRLVQALLHGPEFAYHFLFDIFYTSNGAGFARRLFWTGLSGVPLLALALLAPKLEGRRFAAAFAVCLALSLLPALLYAYMHMVSAEYYAAHGVDTSMQFWTLLLNYWPTSLSLLCYAHMGIDALIRNAMRKRGAEKTSLS